MEAVACLGAGVALASRTARAQAGGLPASRSGASARKQSSSLPGSRATPPPARA